MSGKNWRIRQGLFVLEGTYGDGSVPNVADNTILLSDLDVSPMEGQELDRALIQPSFGMQKQKQVGIHSKITCKVEIAGSGTPGTAPKWGPMLEACAFAKTIAASGTTQASPATPVGTPTGAFTYAATAPYTGLVDRVGTLTCTTAGGTGVAAFTVSAPARFGLAAYSATNVVMTNATPFALPGGATITPAITTPFALADTFTILLKSARTIYRPASQSLLSGSFYGNIDGVLTKLGGARGTVGLEYTAMQIPKFSFEFTGLYSEPVDQAPGAHVTTGWPEPYEVSDVNTPDFTVGGVDMVMQSLTLNMANDVKYKDRVNQQEVRLNNRKPQGSMRVEMLAIEDFNPFALAQAATLQEVFLRHGRTAGNIVNLTTPFTQFGRPKPVEDDGDAFYDIPISAIPGAGDDEVVLEAA